MPQLRPIFTTDTLPHTHTLTILSAPTYRLATRVHATLLRRQNTRKKLQASLLVGLSPMQRLLSSLRRAYGNSNCQRAWCMRRACVRVLYLPACKPRLLDAS